MQNAAKAVEEARISRQHWAARAFQTLLARRHLPPVGSLLPGICATIAAGLCGPLARRDNYSSAGLVLPVLCVGLLIKLARLPDRWIGKTFDLSFSPLHSHCLWHCLVWLCQLCYLSYFEQVLEMERRSWW